MIIRPATLQDLPTLLTIEKLSFASPWHEQHFRYELSENPYAYVMVAEVEQQIIGFIDFWITFQQAQINNVAVIPPLRRKGIGKLLMEDAIQRIRLAGCDQITLEVRVSNLHAQALYRKLGFVSLIKKSHYYDDGEDALMMEKKL